MTNTNHQTEPGIDMQKPMHDIPSKLDPCSASWRNVLGGVIVFLLGVEILTGLLLMTVYSPSATTAWASVWYIQTQVPAGWMIRGVHHFAANALLVAVALRCLQFIAARAYRAPRVLGWVCILILLGMVLDACLTGELLPWDQEGYWGTTVRLNILARTPVIGDTLRRAMAGGDSLGHLTITRFYTLHVMILPALAALCVCGLRVSQRRHLASRSRITPDSASEPYFPGQAFRDSVICAVLLFALVAVSYYARGEWGSNLLAAPADPSMADYPSRPEWHTLFLYQFLKSFHGPFQEFVGSIVLPSFLMTLLLAFPLIDRRAERRAGRFVVLMVTVFGLLAVARLTLAAIATDRDPPDSLVADAKSKRVQGEALSENEEATLRAWRFNRKRERAGERAKRAFQLADELGVPPEGPLSLLVNDPQTRGPELFAANCAACHRFNGHDGLGIAPTEPASASELAGYAKYRWIRGLLSDPLDDRYFGLMKKPDGEPAHTRMSRFINKKLERNEDEESRSALLANFNAVASYLADEGQNPGRLAHVGAKGGVPGSNPASPTQAAVWKGRQFFMKVCNECHSYQGEREGTFNAPEMYGYGSVEWIELMIADPAHETRYRDRGREPAQMPNFEDRLSKHDRRLIAEWLFQSMPIDPPRGDGP